MQVGERLLVIKPGALRHEAFHQLQNTISPIHEPTEDFAPIGIDGAVAPFVEQPFRFRRSFWRRQIEKREEIARLVVGAGLLELCSPLCIDEGGSRIGKCIRGIAASGMALRLDKDRPA